MHFIKDAISSVAGWRLTLIGSLCHAPQSLSPRATSNARCRRNCRRDFIVRQRSQDDNWIASQQAHQQQQGLPGMLRPLQIGRNIPSSDNPENLLTGLTAMRDKHHANAVSTAHRHREHLCNLCERYRTWHEPKRFRGKSVHR